MSKVSPRVHVNCVTFEFPPVRDFVSRTVSHALRPAQHQHAGGTLVTLLKNPRVARRPPALPGGGHTDARNYVASFPHPRAVGTGSLRSRSRSARACRSLTAP
jgi:hypothetical protein